MQNQKVMKIILKSGGILTLKCKDDFMNYKNSSFEDLQKLLREDEKKFDEIHIFLLIFK